MGIRLLILMKALEQLIKKLIGSGTTTPVSFDALFFLVVLECECFLLQKLAFLVLYTPDFCPFFYIFIL